MILTMKYIFILLGVIILVRIDLVIHGIETLARNVSKVSQRPATTDNLVVNDSMVPNDVVSIKEDKSLKRTPRTEFFTLLEEFSLSPTNETRLKLRLIVEKNPKLFSEKLDTDLEAQIFKMIDLIYNKNKEFAFLLLDLLEFLVGENKLMVEKFFTILMDSNLDLFLNTYSKSKDKNCMIAKFLGHKIPEDEVMNELLERQVILHDYLLRDKIDPLIENLAKNCQLVLNLEITKLTTPAESSEPPSNPLPVEPPAKEENNQTPMTSP